MHNRGGEKSSDNTHSSTHDTHDTHDTQDLVNVQSGGMYCVRRPDGNEYFVSRLLFGGGCRQIISKITMPKLYTSHFSS